MSKYFYTYSQTIPYIPPVEYPEDPQMGQVWWNSGICRLCVWDGVDWRDLPDIATVYNIDPKVDDVVDWGLAQTSDTVDIVTLANKYPLVQSALGQLEIALKVARSLEEEQNDKET